MQCFFVLCVCRTTIFYENKVAKPKNKKLAEKLFLVFSNFQNFNFDQNFHEYI
jgi:hypothetical protein